MIREAETHCSQSSVSQLCKNNNANANILLILYIMRHWYTTKQVNYLMPKLTNGD